MRQVSLTILLLSLSNVFMTFAWYAHLKELSAKPWLVAALLSWGVAFFEYMLQVPANRIGYSVLLPSRHTFPWEHQAHEPLDLSLRRHHFRGHRHFIPEKR
jgi:hypothetical protein